MGWVAIFLIKMNGVECSLWVCAHQASADLTCQVDDVRQLLDVQAACGHISRDEKAHISLLRPGASDARHACMWWPLECGG